MSLELLLESKNTQIISCTVSDLECSMAGLVQFEQNWDLQIIHLLGHFCALSFF